MVYTVNSGLAPLINVKVFGAKGDGSTNDTTAVQAAITAAVSTGAELYFPVGVYLCGQLTITDAKGFTIRGPRSNYQSGGVLDTGAVIQWNGGLYTGTAEALITMTDCQDVTWDGVALNGNQGGNASSTLIGVDVVSNNSPASYSLVFTHTLFSGFNQHMLWSSSTNQADRSKIDHCEFALHTSSAIYFNSPNAFDGGVIDNCKFFGENGANDIYVFAAGQFSITNCISGSAGGTPNAFVYVGTDFGSPIRIESCEDEDHTYFLYTNFAFDDAPITLVSNYVNGSISVNGVGRVVGVGNTLQGNVLMGAGCRYQGYGDRFGDTEFSPSSQATGPGTFSNQELAHAATYNDDAWSAGTILWQAPNSYGSTGVAAAQVLRNGSWCAYWTGSTPYAPGAEIQPPSNNGHIYFNAGSTGTSSSSPPVFPTASGAQVTDGTVTWQEDGQSALFTTWGPLGHSVGTGIPSNQYALAGNVIWNSAPATGVAIGWACAVAGNPGTWISFGPYVPSISGSTSSITISAPQVSNNSTTATTEYQNTASITTSNATGTNIFAWPLPTDTSTQMDATVVGSVATGGHVVASVSFKTSALILNDNGTVTLGPVYLNQSAMVGATAVTTGTSATIGASGTIGHVQVIGATGVSYQWGGIFQRIEVT
jgi:hypothetical protein